MKSFKQFITETKQHPIQSKELRKFIKMHSIKGSTSTGKLASVRTQRFVRHDDHIGRFTEWGNAEATAYIPIENMDKVEKSAKENNINFHKSGVEINGHHLVHLTR